MAKREFSAAEERTLRNLVQYYSDNQRLISTFQNAVVGALKEDSDLNSLIHTIRFRLKAPDHLLDKLQRKLRKAKKANDEFSITPENLFSEINDLAGVRILHLHTSQMPQIDARLRQLLEEQQYPILEGPMARTWDDEYRAFFEKHSIKTMSSAETMYTSVHYVIASNSKARVTCELQVRTLMEEVWGEVDHKINYPHPIGSVACSEQIKALARSTSSATRLVDAIFATLADLQSAE